MTKAKRANINLVQHTDFTVKKTSTNPSKKINKTLHQHHKTNCFCRINAYQKPRPQEEAKHGKGNCDKLASDTEANLRTTKRAKVRNSA